MTERTCHASTRRHAASGRIQVQYHGCSTGLRISAVPITQSNPRFQFRMKKSRNNHHCDNNDDVVVIVFLVRIRPERFLNDPPKHVVQTRDIDEATQRLPDRDLRKTKGQAEESGNYQADDKRDRTATQRESADRQEEQRDEFDRNRGTQRDRTKNRIGATGRSAPRQNCCARKRRCRRASAGSSDCRNAPPRRNCRRRADSRHTRRRRRSATRPPINRKSTAMAQRSAAAKSNL